MSGESDKRGLDPNATIQLDALDGVELEDFDPPSAAGTDTGLAREAPPPLPEAPAQPIRRPVRNTLAYSALFVGLVAAAIVAGLIVGSRTRAKLAAPAVTSSASASNVLAPTTVPGLPSARTLTLPTIEIKSP